MTVTDTSTARRWPATRRGPRPARAIDDPDLERGLDAVAVRFAEGLP